MDSISAKELRSFMTDKSSYILYLLRLGIGEEGAFKSMVEMAEDLGVSSGYIRQVKHRMIHKRTKLVHQPDYVKGVLQLWAR